VSFPETGRVATSEGIRAPSTLYTLPHYYRAALRSAHSGSVPGAQRRDCGATPPSPSPDSLRRDHTSRCCLHASSSPVYGPQDFHRLDVEGCGAFHEPTMAGRLAGESEDAAELQLLKERGSTATPAPLGAAAVPQKHPVDRHVRPLYTGGDAPSHPPVPATEIRAVPSC